MFPNLFLGFNRKTKKYSYFLKKNDSLKVIRRGEACILFFFGEEGRLVFLFPNTVQVFFAKQRAPKELVFDEGRLTMEQRKVIPI